MTLKDYAELVAGLFEFAGITVMLVGALWAPVSLFLKRRKGDARSSFILIRNALASSILIGLELLVAADIVRTISEDPELRPVLILGLIVLIRTFLSLTLEVELEGTWPWKRKETREG